MRIRVCLYLLLAGGLVLAGCARKKTAQQVAEGLQQTFQKADEPARAQVAQAGVALKAGNYEQAVVAMNRAVQEQPVTEAQRKAVSALIEQTRRAVAERPELNTPQLYKATTDLIKRTYPEN